MKLSQKQEEAFDECMHFFLESDKKLFVLSGVAGSGKSVIINELMEFIDNEVKEFITEKKVAVMTLTGKAAKVLRDKGVDCAQTIHSYLYVPQIDANGDLIGFLPIDPQKLTNDYIIIDEGSMVTEEIYNDLKALGKKILVVGDVNQLEPVVIDGRSSFNLMKNPNIRLEEIHRQAENSPIIILSQHILETGRLPTRSFHDDIRYIRKNNTEQHLIKNANIHDIVLCGTHRVRTKLNKAARKHYGRFNRYPEVGDKVICLRNNKYRFPATFNGEIFTVMSADKNNYLHKGKEELRKYEVLNTIYNEKYDKNPCFHIIVDDDLWFNGHSELKTIKPINEEEGEFIDFRPPDIFDFAEAITVHKSQGSEFDDVLYIDDDVSYFCDQQKFRYTAITRAKKTLTIAK